MWDMITILQGNDTFDFFSNTSMSDIELPGLSKANTVSRHFHLPNLMFCNSDLYLASTGYPPCTEYSVRRS